MALHQLVYEKGIAARTGLVDRMKTGIPPKQKRNGNQKAFAL
jgi:hypothetical protein